MPSPALFVAAHPDDELLGPGVALAEHLAAGQDVHLLWLTCGTASGARAYINGTATSSWWKVAHDPASEGYVPLGLAEFGEARIREGTAAVRCLAAGLPGTLTIHQANLLDGAVTQSAAFDAILDVADTIAPGGPVRIKTHSHRVETGADHLAAGWAAVQLKAELPARFSDLRHYVLPDYWADPRLSQVTESWDLPTDAGITARVRNAIRAYGAWQPASGAFAIGYHSVPGQLDKLAATPKSLAHL